MKPQPPRMQSDQAQESMITSACRYLGDALSAREVLVGLPEVVRQVAAIPGTTRIEEVLERLPRGDRLPASVGVENGAVVKGIYPLEEDDENEERLYWATSPFDLENYPSGLLLVTRSQPFRTEDIQFLAESGAQLLSVPIEHALFKQVAARYRDSMETLHKVSLRITSTLNLQDVVHLLVEAVLDLLPADCAHIYVTQTGKGNHEPPSEAPVFQFGAALWRDGRKMSSPPAPKPDDLEAAVARSGEPVIISQSRRYTAASPDEMEWRVESVAGYPLLRDKRVLGVISLTFFKPHTFTSEERHLLSLFADQAATAIENAHTARILSHRLTEMAMLQGLALKVSSSLDVDEVMQTILQSLKSLSNAYAATIMLVDDTQKLRVAATEGLSLHVAENAIFQPGEGIGGHVLLTKKPIYVPDTLADERFVLVDSALRSMMVVPLVTKGKVIGTVSVDSNQPHAFGPEVERLLTIVAGQTATAIENARLYQDEHRRADELNTITDLSRSITQNLEMDQVFDSAYRAVLRLMPCEAFIISLRDRETEETHATYLVDKDKRYPPVHWPKGAGLSGHVITTGSSILIPDMQSFEPPFKPSRYGDTDSDPVRSIIATPLRFSGEVIGAVSAQSYQPNIYSEHDLHLLESIGDHIAVAIENSRLYTDLKTHYLSLQDLEQARVEFIQNISHELRTPLTFLRAYVDLLLENEMGGLNKKQRQSLTIVQAKTATLVRLVEDITTLETNRPDWLLIQDVNLLELAHAAIQQMEVAAAASRNRLVIEAPQDFPSVQGDPGRLSQIFDNLLTNALKFGAPDSEVVVRLEAQAEHVLVSVIDQGPGIPVNECERIFERFYQGDGSISRRQSGLGLGLAIVKHIVEAHEGKVWVESEPDQGSTFFVQLPYRLSGKDRGRQ